jgi:aspartyl protease family protein
MLAWAFRYLAMAIAVGVGFAALQDSAWLDRTVASFAAQRGSAGAPAERIADNPLEHVVEAGPGGHFVIEVAVNGTPVTFLVDTGASDVVLTIDDARRLGLRPRTLHYSQRFQTANGEVRGAPVTLREVRLGQLRLFDLPASVNQGALGVSLLGMSFLERLRGYEVADGRLILRW